MNKRPFFEASIHACFSNHLRVISDHPTLHHQPITRHSVVNGFPENKDNEIFPPHHARSTIALRFRRTYRETSKRRPLQRKLFPWWFGVSHSPPVAKTETVLYLEM